MAQASNNIDRYRQKCDYKISNFNTEIVKAKFKLPDDPDSVTVCETIIENISANIKVKFDDNSLYENERRVLFEGPRLWSTCTISGIKETFYHREFGYIQTSKRFYESEFENAIVYSDFHANLLHNQDEVLDCGRESSPFYSTESCTKVPADKLPSHTINLYFTDRPSSDIFKNIDCQSSETSKHNWGCLQKHERYQQFFVYLVMRSKKNDEEWTYKELYSFDWFIYLKWIKGSGKNNNIFEYNCGLNEHIKKRNLTKKMENFTCNDEYNCDINENNPVRKLPELMEYYTCNDDQFVYWIDKIDCNIYIYRYPKSILQSKLESITSNVNKLCGNDEITDSNTANLECIASSDLDVSTIMNEYKNYKGIDGLLLKGKNLEKDVKSLNSKINYFFEDYEIIASEVKKFSKDIENMDGEENINRENFKNIAAKVGELYGSIKRLDTKERKDYEAINRLLPEVVKLYKEVKKMDLNKNKTFENYSDVEKLFADRENIDSEDFRRDFSNIVRKVKNLDVCITEIDPIELNIYESIDRLLPKLKKLTDEIERIYLEKIDFNENFSRIRLEVDKLCECIEMMESDKKEFRDNYTMTSREVRRLLTCTKRKDLKGIKELIESLNPKVKKLCKDEGINFEKYKICKCKNLTEMELCEIIKNKNFERNNKDNFEEVEQQPIAENNRTLSEQDKFSPLPSGAVITSNEDAIDES